MVAASRLAVAVGYTFAAWLLAAMLIYAGYAWLPRPWAAIAHWGGIVVTFVPVFRLYFRGPLPLPPALAAGVAVGFIALLDLYLVAPYFLHSYDLFLSFWDWQGPALIVAASVYLAGRASSERA
jgi:hypothetical protein